MSLIDQIAEKHIEAAVQRGELNNLPGMGQPLELDDDSRIPPELRAGYRLLKNANFLPPELQALKDIQRIELLLSSLQKEDEHNDAQTKLALIRTKLNQFSRR